MKTNMYKKILVRYTAVLLVMTILTVLSACGRGNGNASSGSTSESAGETEEAQTETAAEPETQLQIDNEKPVKLYVMDYSDNSASLIKTYEAQWDDQQDLGIFGAFNSDEPVIYFESEKYAHLDLWDAVDTEKDYRIGYEISFDAAGRHYVFTLLEPQDIEDAPELFSGDVDTEEVTGYLGVWMYDDVHQEDGAWYSHVAPEEYNDETLLTGIKLRLTPAYEEVSGLKLKTFSYSSMLEFDADRHYNNVYSYEISIISE